MRTLQHEAKTSKPNTVAHCYRCYAAMHIFKKAPAKSACPNVYTFIPWSYSENGRRGGCKPNSHSHTQTLHFSCTEGTRTSVKAPQATQQQFRCCKVLRTLVLTDGCGPFSRLTTPGVASATQATRLRAPIAEHCRAALTLADNLARVQRPGSSDALVARKAFALLKSVSFNSLAPSVKRQLSGLMSSVSENMTNWMLLHR